MIIAFRDTAEGLGTMSGRQFGRVILDEVDNMLVDNGRHIAKISSPFPGMESLKYIYVRIWSELLMVESELMEDFQEKLKEFSVYDNSKEMAVREFVKIFDASMIGRMEERIKENLKVEYGH
jgi:preprotein translocase subunit SecA